MYRRYISTIIIIIITAMTPQGRKKILFLGAQPGAGCSKVG
jgi:hypothetical protein